MATRPRQRRNKDGIRIRGFFRVRLVEHESDGMPRIVGDTGWNENTVVMLGKMQYLALALGSQGGSKYISRLALGTGTAPATNATSLPGELADAVTGSFNRPAAAVSTGSSGASVSVQFAATWASANSFATATHNIGNIAVLWTETTGGTIFAGTTFASSLLNTNQDVQASYVISFS